MQVDLQQLMPDAYGNYEQPTLLLTTLDDTPICTVTGITSLEASFIYNDVSELTFTVVAELYNEATGEFYANPCFDQLIGMRKVFLMPFGKFVIVNPEITGEGREKSVAVTCYSYEYALNYKQIGPLSGTFMLHDPTGASEDTMTTLILEKAPDWQIGHVSSTLCSKYRTFDTTEETLYSFLSGDFQTSYGCIVTYDTINKLINIYDQTMDVDTLNIHLDKYNLISQEEIEELSDEIVTVLTPYGADDVTISSVNPIGEKLYNFDYFISLGDISGDLAVAWTNWKEKYAIYQTLFSDLFSQYYNNQLVLNNQNTALVDLEGELYTMEVVLDTYLTDTDGDHNDEIIALEADMIAKQAEIDAQQAVVDAANEQLESDLAMMSQIAELCSFKNNFTEEQIEILNIYSKEDTLQDTTYVVSYTSDEATAYSSVTEDNPITIKISKGDLYRSDDYVTLTDEEIAALDLDDEELAELLEIQSNISSTYLGRYFFTINTGYGSILDANGDFELYGTVVSSTLSYSAEANEDGSYDALVAFSLNDPAYNGDETSYSTAMFVASGTITDFSYSHDAETENEDTMQFVFNSGIMTLTCDTTINQRQQVLQELYEYGEAALAELAWPSYEFSVDAANLFAAEDFERFREDIALGKKMFLEFKDDYYLEPILIQVDIDFMDVSSLSLTFSNKFRGNNPEFALADILGDSAKTTASLDSSKYSYNSFINSNIQNDVESLINDSLDLAKKSIINSTNQSFLADGQGIHLRKYYAETGTYDPAEIRLINNKIVFTDDSWTTASLAIGQIYTSDGSYTMGVVAQSLIGEILIGNKLLIEATNYDEKYEGTVTHFRVDAGGVKLANGAINIQGADPHNQIVIDPDIGIMAGDSTLFTMGESAFEYNIYDEDGELVYDEELYYNYDLKIPTGAQFFFDINTGNLVFRGDIYANNGYFRGTVYATDGEFTGKITATELDCTNATVSGLTVGDNVTMGSNATISWSNVTGTSGVATVSYVNSATSSSAITQITQTAITTGTLYLGGNVYRLNDGAITAADSYLMIGKNSFSNLQIGSPSTSEYTDTTLYAQNNVYILPGGVTLGSQEEDTSGWTACFRYHSDTNRGLTVRGNISATGNMYIDSARVLTTADLEAVSDGDSSTVNNSHYHSGKTIKCIGITPCESDGSTSVGTFTFGSSSDRCTVITGAVRPIVNGSVSCGTSSYYWSSVYGNTFNGTTANLTGLSITGSTSTSATASTGAVIISSLPTASSNGANVRIASDGRLYKVDDSLVYSGSGTVTAVFG